MRPLIRLVAKLLFQRYVTAWLPWSNLRVLLHASQDMVNLFVRKRRFCDGPTYCREPFRHLHRIPMLFRLNGRPARAPCAVRDNVVLQCCDNGQDCALVQCSSTPACSLETWNSVVTPRASTLFTFFTADLLFCSALGSKCRQPRSPCTSMWSWRRYGLCS